MNKEKRRLFAQFSDNPEVFRVRHSKCAAVWELLCSRAEKADSLECLMYWGVTDRRLPGAAEGAAIEFLRAWKDDLEAILEVTFPIHFILTDTHGAVNRYSESKVKSYVDKMQIIFGNNNWKSTQCSEELGISWDFDWPDAHFDPIAANCVWMSLSKNARNQLSMFASNHAKNREPVEAAVRYVYQNYLENKVIKRKHQDKILITYNLPTLNGLLPSLPKIHAFVGEKKIVKRPWFADTE